MLGRAMAKSVRRRANHLVVAPLLIAALAACSSTDDRSYPADVRRNFMSACIGNGGTRDSCTCEFEAIEGELTLDEYVDLEAELLATGVIPADLVAAMDSCPGAIPTDGSLAPTAGQQILSQADSFELTVTGTTFESDMLGAETVCVAVSVSNPTSADVMALGVFSLALPSGRIEYPVDGDPIPALAPGGSGSGSMCFRSNGERGQAQLRYASPVTSYSWPMNIG